MLPEVYIGGTVKFIIPVESISQGKGGVVIYDPINNKILEQYTHDKEWKFRVGWRGGILYKDYFITTDWTDIHYFNHSTWKYEKTFKKKSFNDLHYLNIKDDQLYVVNTGIDAIEIFNDPLNPKHQTSISVFARNPKIFTQRKLEPKAAYNKRFKMKPHAAHPNSICFGVKNSYITCFEKDGKMNSGEIISLDGTRMIRSGFSCHDSHIINGDFYTTHTRHSRLLMFKKFENRKLPINKPDEVFSIKKKAWWRGCVFAEGKAFIFASKYSRRKATAVMCTLDMKKGQTKFFTLPSHDGMFWDTVYQPNLFEE